MNSVRGWIQVLQKLEWKMFIVPRPQVVKETPKTDKRFVDTHGNKNDEPMPQPHPCSQNPDVRNGGSSTSQLVVSLNRNMYVDNPSGEVYNPFNCERESAQYPYVDIGSIGSGSSTERLVVDVRQHIDIENISDIANVPPYDNLSSSGIDKNYRKGRRRGFVAGVLLVVLCFLIAVAIALGLYFSKDPAISMEYPEHDMYESTVNTVGTAVSRTLLTASCLCDLCKGCNSVQTNPHFNADSWFFSRVDLNVKVNETFQAAMSNNTSREFLEFQDRFCNNIKQTLTQEVTDVQSCEINKLSNGSIIVNSTLLLQSKKEISQKYLLNVLKERNTTKNGSTSLDNNSTELGDLLVDTLEITRFVSHFVKTCAKGDNFDCSTESICRFLPLKDTYPSNCNKFQLCIKNRGEKFQCDDGLEFAYISSSDTTICKNPSTSTYCGLRRATDPTPPSYNCTEMFPLFKNLSYIYECPRDGGDYYIPRNDTYPDNCNTYTWCTNGHEYNQTSPDGTHFVYRTQIEGAPWDHYYAPSTYCVQRRMYEDCLNKSALPVE